MNFQKLQNGFVRCGPRSGGAAQVDNKFKRIALCSKNPDGHGNKEGQGSLCSRLRRPTPPTFLLAFEHGTNSGAAAAAYRQRLRPWFEARSLELNFVIAGL